MAGEWQSRDAIGDAARDRIVASLQRHFAGETYELRVRYRDGRSPFMAADIDSDDGRIDMRPTDYVAVSERVRAKRRRAVSST